MKKLLIADDEPLVLVGLQSMLRWEDYGVEICATARNGQQALELIEQHRPDLVITDIKMPLMTGLELAEACRARGWALPVFLMLTSYEEFGFVREALHVGAVAYLIKLELTPQALAESSARAIARVEVIRGAEAATQSAGQGGLQAFREKFFVRLYNGLFESREQFDRQRQDLGLDLCAPAYAVASCEISGIDTAALSTEKLLTLYASTIQVVQDTAPKFIPCYVTSLDLRRFNILFCLPENWPDAEARMADALEKTARLVHNYFNVALLCGVGLVVADAFGVCESYRSARAAAASAVPGIPALAGQDGAAADLFDLSRYRKALTRAFEEFDTEALHTAIAEIAAYFEQHPGQTMQAVDTAGSLLYMAISLLPEGEATVEQIFADTPEGYRSLYRQQSAAQCAAWMLQLDEGLCRTLQARRQSYKERVVASVKDYLRANLDKKLTLNEVAAAFNFSPSYLSQLFARHSDHGFVETITEEKIAAAKRLLQQGDQKIYEIAESLGYESAFYFSKVFKKVTGLSPREYLQNQTNGGPER